MDPSRPGDVASISVTAGAHGSAQLSWTAPDVSANDAPTFYEIDRSSIADPGRIVAVLPASATSYTDTGLADGTHYDYAVIAGNPSGLGDAYPSASVVADAVGPTASITSPTATYQASTTMTVGYTASDSGTGVAAYDIRYKAASYNGSFASYVYPPAWQGRTTAAALSLVGSAGHEYCFSARAHDHAGNASASWSPDRCTVVPVDDHTMTTIAGTWSRPTTVSSAYLKTTSSAAAASAELRLVGVSTRGLELLVTTCSHCGGVAVYVNGAYWGTVNTYSATTHYKVLLPVKTLTPRTTTVVLKTTSSKSVIIDGLGVLNPIT